MIPVRLDENFEIRYGDQPAGMGSTVEPLPPTDQQVRDELARREEVYAAHGGCRHWSHILGFGSCPNCGPG